MFRSRNRNIRNHSRDKTIFYGINSDDIYSRNSLVDNLIPPQNVISNIDDVTGKRIAAEDIVIQDGLIKDRRVRAGSYENEDRFNKDVIFIMYDPALGFPRKAAGE